MKKFFVFMTVMAAMALTVVSCSKSEDGDSEENRLKFANALTQNSTSCTWEGFDKAQRKEMGNNWNDERQSYVVIRFDRASTSSTTGTGMILTFENMYKDVENFKEASEFTWYFDNDQLHISYRHQGWKPVYAEYRTQELVISGDTFRGYWFEQTDFRYQFSYTKSAFNEWNKFVN